MFLDEVNQLVNMGQPGPTKNHDFITVVTIDKVHIFLREFADFAKSRLFRKFQVIVRHSVCVRG